jgi:hypothetical protein
MTSLSFSILRDYVSGRGTCGSCVSNGTVDG